MAFTSKSERFTNLFGVNKSNADGGDQQDKSRNLEDASLHQGSQRVVTQAKAPFNSSTVRVVGAEDLSKYYNPGR